MILTSHQPDFLPYMGVVYKAAMCDTLVFSDDVLYSKKGMHNWNRIKAPGAAQRLTIPVHAHHNLRLCEVTVSDVRRSLTMAIKTIDQNYRKAPHYDEGASILSEIIRLSERQRLDMTELNLSLTLPILERFGIRPTVLVASEDLHLAGQKDERIFQMCEELGADTYISGTGAADYHRPEEFQLRGIDLIYSEYRPPVYPQLHGPFIGNLSMIDYIFNCGYTLPEEWRRDNG